ncbi:MAG: 2-oxo acid dehydrogenase subunit E2 [Planctomycetota bacterium]|nr:2-oxo acid dehydrogenase subunit E2 [Planctomycetota bacterium]
MAADVKLPGLGEGVESGDVLEIFVSEGETVTKDQNLMELETDKATVVVPAPEAGTIAKVSVAVGQTVNVGDVIAQLEGGVAPAAAPEPTPEPDAAPPPVPEQKPEPVSEAPAPSAPAATPPPAAPAPVVPAAPAPVVPAAPAPVATAPASSGSDDPIPAGPSVKRFAREVGVDLSTVTGTAEGGRITREDVLAAVRASSAKPAAPSVPSTTASTTVLTPANVPVPSPVGGNTPMTLPGDPGQDEYGPVRVERLSKIRKTIANQMHASWSTVPRVTNFDDADVTDLETFRRSSKDDYAAQGIKLTTMPFLIKAVATALRLHPAMNAVIDMDNDQVTYRDYVNMGIAIDSERGLVVPNLRHVDSLGIPEIAKGLADLATRVRNNNFGVDELRGGTFTISNLGAIGGTYSTPIVNVPEVAILLVGRTRKLPVVMEDDSIQARQMMPLSLSYDHRLVDGATAARFLNHVIALLEAPSRLLLAIN